MSSWGSLSHEGHFAQGRGCTQLASPRDTYCLWPKYYQKFPRAAYSRNCQEGGPPSYRN